MPVGGAALAAKDVARSVQHAAVLCSGYAVVVGAPTAL